MGGTGLGQVAAHDATPNATPGSTSAEKVSYLFVQSFQSGSITPTDGVADRYTVTLEQGLGETIYFGDRPSRDVGTTPTPQFLEGLGFPPNDPPNATLLVETAPGETGIAVVELYNPSYDPTTRGVTYEVAVLEDWGDRLDLGLRDAPADLATLAPQFGAAYLLIDDCPEIEVDCESYYQVGSFGNLPACWNYSVCMPCEPFGHDQPSYCATADYWHNKCNQDFPDCDGGCTASLSWAGYVCPE